MEDFTGPDRSDHMQADTILPALSEGTSSFTYRDRTVELFVGQEYWGFCALKREISLTVGGVVVAHEVEYLDNWAPHIVRGMLTDRLRQYFDALEIFAVEIDRQLSALPRAASKKAKNQLLEAAALIQNGTLVADGRSFGLVVGEQFIVLPSYFCSKTEKFAFGNLMIYKVGDQACWGSYNISYLGEILSISPKTVKVRKDSHRTTNMKLSKFLSYNVISVANRAKRNEEMYLTI